MKIVYPTRYSQIYNILNRHFEARTTMPSVQEIGDELSLSKTSVSNAMRDMEQLGYIKRCGVRAVTLLSEPEQV